MSVDITIQETVNEVDITVNQNVITVNVTRTTGGGGVDSVTGTLVDNTDPNNPVINTPTKTSDLTNDGENNTSTFVESNELGAVAFSNNYNDLDNKPTIPTPQNLTQVLTQGDISSWFEIFPSFPANSFITIALGRELTDNYYDTFFAGTGGLFLDKNIIFPDNATIRFQAGYVEDNPIPTGSTLYPYRFTTDAYVFYQGAIVTDITLQPEDVCTLKWGGYNSTDSIQIWFLTIVSSGGSGTVTNVSGTTDEITVSNPTTTPVVGISPNYTTARDAYADAKVADNLTASTTVAPSKTAVNTALDFTRRLITKGTGSVTGTVSETILTTLTIPANTLDSSCFIWTTMDFFKNSSGAVTTRLYINNANTLTGATLLGFSTLGSNRNVSFNRKFLVTGTSLDLLTANTASPQVTNEFIENLYGASTVLTINPSADIFLIYTTQNDATGTVATNKMATVQKMKL